VLDLFDPNGRESRRVDADQEDHFDRSREIAAQGTKVGEIRRTVELSLREGARVAGWIARACDEA